MIICADDYGMRTDINRAILQLCDTGKLSAVSCMVLFERCDRGLMAKIRAHENHIDVGLHLCLTNENMRQSAPLERQRLPGFKTFLYRSMFRQLSRRETFELFAAQYDLFLKKSGRAPDFIDSHRHVHQLPVLAETLVEFVHRMPVEQRPYIRNTYLPATDLRRRNLPWLKARCIGACGSRLERKLAAYRLPTNIGFAGIYNFKRARDYAKFLPKFAACLPGANGILVTHPGLDEDWRRREFEALQRFSSGANRFVHGTATRATPLP